MGHEQTLLRMWQAVLLQVLDSLLWHVYRSLLGLRVRHFEFRPRVVLDAIHERLFCVYRLLAETVWNLPELLSNPCL